MGADGFYPEEAPVHTVTVSGFWMDEHTVTNAEFATFVAATGYRTVAERPLDPATYPGADSPAHAQRLRVLHASGRAELNDIRSRWTYGCRAQTGAIQRTKRGKHHEPTPTIRLTTSAHTRSRNIR